MMFSLRTLVPAVLLLAGQGLASVSEPITTDTVIDSTTICPETATPSVAAQSSSSVAPSSVAPSSAPAVTTSTVYITATSTTVLTQTVVVSTTVCGASSQTVPTTRPRPTSAPVVSSPSAPNTVPTVPNTVAPVSSISGGSRPTGGNSSPVPYTPTYRPMKTTTTAAPAFTGGASTVGAAGLMVPFAAAVAALIV